MKYTTTLCIVFAIHLGLYSQSLTPTLTSTAGTSYDAGEIKLEWALGELAVSTYQNQSIMTEGFLQTDLNVINSWNEPQLDIELIIYPNPVAHTLMIRQVGQANLKVSLYDILGRNVLVESVSEALNEISMINYQSGQYILVIEDDNGFSNSYKFIKI